MKKKQEKSAVEPAADKRTTGGHSRFAVVLVATALALAPLFPVGGGGNTGNDVSSIVI